MVKKYQQPYEQAIRPETDTISRRSVLLGLGVVPAALLLASCSPRESELPPSEEQVSRIELERDASVLRQRIYELQMSYADRLVDLLEGETGSLETISIGRAHHDGLQGDHMNMEMTVAEADGKVSVHLFTQVHEAGDPRCEPDVYGGPKTESIESVWYLYNNTELPEKLRSGGVPWIELYGAIEHHRPSRTTVRLPMDSENETTVTVSGVDGTNIEVLEPGDEPSIDGVVLTPALLEKAAAVVEDVQTNIEAKTGYR